MFRFHRILQGWPRSPRSSLPSPCVVRHHHPLQHAPKALSKQFDARIRAEAAALVQAVRSEGLQGVVDAVHERDRTPGSLDFGLQGPPGMLHGRGQQPRSAPRPGLVDIRSPGRRPARGASPALRGFLALTATNSWSATTRSASGALDGAVIRASASAFAGVLILGFAAGLALSRRCPPAHGGDLESSRGGDHRRGFEPANLPVRGSDD